VGQAAPGHCDVCLRMAVIQWLASTTGPGPGTGGLRTGSVTMPVPGFHGDSGPVLQGKPEDPVLSRESVRKQIRPEQQST
jgi:hypothetical protein